MSAVSTRIEHMFESVAIADVTHWVGALASLDTATSDDPARIDALRALEELKAAAAAAQARISVAFDASQRQAHADAGLPARRRGEGVAAQVALARRESPHRGAQHLGLATILTREMPHTLAALSAGWLSEWRATLLARETACLTLADRRCVDATLCADPATLDGLSDRAILAEAKRLAYRLDPESVVRQARRAETERTVTIRPAPDTMTYVTGLLPVAAGVSVYAALRREADRLTASGDGRTHGQIMADTLVERVTGRATATEQPVEVRVVMTDRSLLRGDHEPAVLEGYGVVPAEWARHLVSGAADRGQAWARRLYTAPGTHQLVTMDSRARLAPTGLASFVDTRDQTCRTPWCGAPIRHHDHIEPHDAGGPTTADNLQGLCARCNLAKQAPGWRARPRAGPHHTVAITTPTGHRYESTAPAPPGSATEPSSRLDTLFASLVLTA